jgi:hypothetical protein
LIEGGLSLIGEGEPQSTPGSGLIALWRYLVEGVGQRVLRSSGEVVVDASTKGAIHSTNVRDMSEKTQISCNGLGRLVGLGGIATGPKPLAGWLVTNL